MRRFGVAEEQRRRPGGALFISGPSVAVAVDVAVAVAEREQVVPRASPQLPRRLFSSGIPRAPFVHDHGNGPRTSLPPGGRSPLRRGPRGSQNASCQGGRTRRIVPRPILWQAHPVRRDPRRRAAATHRAILSQIRMGRGKGRSGRDARAPGADRILLRSEIGKREGRLRPSRGTEIPEVLLI